jgi:pimeloyl-ACP methyl ester carboxylesterase
LEKLSMPQPFNRGWNRQDFLVASLVAYGQIQFADDLAFSALDAVEGGSHFTFAGNDLLPASIVSITPNYVFVGVQGTASWQQWVFNFLASAQFPIPGLQGQVDVFFGTASLFIFNQIRSTVIPALASRKLVLIGHSLGGAICQCLVNLLSPFASSGVSCFVLGCPRVGNPTFAASIDAATLRCENTEDPICPLPPVLWAGPGSVFPIPGPPPFAIYSHGGTVKTLDQGGVLTDGSQLISIPAILVQLLSRTAPSHYAQEYARRLRIGLTSDQITNGSGYANGAGIERLFGYITGIFSSLQLSGVQAMTQKVTLFYDYRRVGVTETFYTPASSPQPVINAYLAKRMMLAVKDFSLSYVRVSNVPQNRHVSFFVPTDFSVVNGQLGPITSAQGPQALLFRITTNLFSQARIFLHGFGRTQITNDTYMPDPAFAAAVDQFVQLLITTGNYLFASVPSHTFADRKSIVAIADFPPRGAKITPALVADTPVVGDTITIGGTGARVIGANGRKRVTFVDPARAFFIVGGAQPVIGSFTPPAYFYNANPLFGTPISAAIERLTTHRVGRPFGLRPGRQRATVALRA